MEISKMSEDQDIRNFKILIYEAIAVAVGAQMIDALLHTNVWILVIGWMICAALASFVFSLVCGELSLAVVLLSIIFAPVALLHSLFVLFTRIKIWRRK